MKLLLLALVTSVHALIIPFRGVVRDFADEDGFEYSEVFAGEAEFFDSGALLAKASLSDFARETLNVPDVIQTVGARVDSTGDVAAHDLLMPMAPTLKALSRVSRVSNELGVSIASMLHEISLTKFRSDTDLAQQLFENRLLTDERVQQCDKVTALNAASQEWVLLCWKKRQTFAEDSEKVLRLHKLVAQWLEIYFESNGDVALLTGSSAAISTQNAAFDSFLQSVSVPPTRPFWMPIDKTENQKRCVFIHGAGNRQRSFDPVQHGSFKDYWGKVHKHTPQCSQHVFLNTDSIHSGWDTKDLEMATCEALTGERRGGVAKDVIVFAHSMGNLAIAAALKSGRCSFAQDGSVTWYAVQGPSHGSDVVEWLYELCGDDSGFFDPAVRKVAELMNYCDKSDRVPNYGYQTCHPEWPDIETLNGIIARTAVGGMCGVSSSGLNTVYAPGLKLIASMSGTAKPNDGIVPLIGCDFLNKPGHHDDWSNERYSPGDERWQSGYQEDYALLDVNHADGTCRNNDGWWGDDRKPCSWFGDRT